MLASKNRRARAPDVLTRLADHLGQAGHQVSTANDGSAACALVAKRQPNAVIADVRMSVGPACLDGDDVGLEGLIGTSPAMKWVHRAARRVAGSRATVLVTGETGTGKGELARAIHALSPRAEKPFLQIHCAALVDSLLESELFGHEKGSFTGADRRRIGRFEQADGGTLFLDEVGELSSLTQVKLLRVLQERTFERVGSNEAIRVDVRVIAATNRDLAADIESGRFREDLYYRLNVVHVEMPPLRHRATDVATLANHFLRRFALENGKHLDGLTGAACAMLAAYPWPGNVRALENAIERAVVLSSRSVIDVDDFALDDAGADELRGTLRGRGSTMAAIERRAILAALESCGGSTLRAAEMLQISARTIQYRLHEYGLRPPCPRTTTIGHAARGRAASAAVTRGDVRRGHVRPEPGSGRHVVERQGQLERAGLAELARSADSSAVGPDPAVEHVELDHASVG